MGADTNKTRGHCPPTQVLPDTAALKREEFSPAPAHGGGRDATLSSAGQPVSAGAAGPVALATAAAHGKAVGRAGAGTAGAADGMLVRKGRGMGNRVARLGLALDDVQTRADRAAGRSSKGLRARSGQRVCVALGYCTGRGRNK